MKSIKHNKITKDYKVTKQKHLERLANTMLKNDKKSSKLKEKTINKNILKLF